MNRLSVSHIRIKFLLSVLRAVVLSLECTHADQAATGFLAEDIACTELLLNTRFLVLLLEPVLQAVIGLVAFLDRINRHRVVGAYRRLLRM